MGVRGAEIPVSLLLAHPRLDHDRRERLLDRVPGVPRPLLSALVAGCVRSRRVVDKFVGDEVIGLFFRGISGDRHTAAAVAAGRDLLAHAGRTDATPMGAIPVGAAVHTGMAFVGSTATDDVVSDFTALGDPVNTTGPRRDEPNSVHRPRSCAPGHSVSASGRAREEPLEVLLGLGGERTLSQVRWPQACARSAGVAVEPTLHESRQAKGTATPEIARDRCPSADALVPRCVQVEWRDKRDGPGLLISHRRLDPGSPTHPR
jgi:hypothetical protein